MKIKLIALKDHSPDGARQVKRGEVFEISATAAPILIATKRAEFVDKPKKSSGTYKRRDMRAE